MPCLGREKLQKCARPIATVLLLLVALPVTLIYFNVRRTIRNSNYCFVSQSYAQEKSLPHLITTQEDISRRRALETDLSFYGIYSSGRTKFPPPSKPQKNAKVFQLVASSTSPSSYFEQYITKLGWPSAPLLTSQLISPVSIHNNNEKERSNKNGLFSIVYNPNSSSWCLHANSEKLFCSEASVIEIQQQKEKIVPSFPSSGIWYSQTLEFLPVKSIQVICPTSHNADNNNKERTRKNNNKQNKNLHQILSRPATTFILMLNVYLAYYYWNYRVPPSSVSKIYNRIVLEKEIWRSFTGALAHFEPLHIGFNMMSFLSLGEALEEWGYGSLPFLCLNLALIPCTTIIMMLITSYRIKKANKDGNGSLALSLGESSTVGYSGVLFAWMVIVTMEQEQSCPVFFLPDMCFNTYTIWGNILKFNISPFVQLAVMQIIIPRVSFVGHLSGIICGFILHWNFSLYGLLVPHVFFNIGIMIWLYFVEKVIPIKKPEEIGIDPVMLDDSSSPALPPSANQDPFYESMRQVLTNFFAERTDVQNRTKALLTITSYLHAAVSILTFSTCDLGMTFAQTISTVIFYCGTRLFADSVNSSRQSSYTGSIGIIMQGYFVSSIILVVTDSMSIPCWFLTKSWLQSDRTFLFHKFSVVLICAVLRIVVNIWSLILCAKILGDTKCSSFYKNVFGFVMNECRVVGDILIAPTFNAFSGQGFVTTSAPLV